jgi:hypothetical protein
VTLPLFYKEKPTVDYFKPAPAAPGVTSSYKYKLRLLYFVTHSYLSKSKSPNWTNVRWNVCQPVKYPQIYDLTLCRPCIAVYQYSETNVMHFLFNLLRIRGLYIFRTLLSYPQEALHKRHLVYFVHVMSVDCYQDWSGTLLYIF